LQRLATVYYGADVECLHWDLTKASTYTTHHDKEALKSWQNIYHDKQARVDPAKYISCFSHKHMITRTHYDVREANDPGAGAAASLYNSIVKQLPYVSKLSFHFWRNFINPQIYTEIHQGRNSTNALR
jgi:hypothetical protein